MLELLDEALKIKSRDIIEIDADRYTIVGDIHADYNALKKILMHRSSPTIFLGDYADRGNDPINVYKTILEGYISGEFILLRGNHESENVFPHDLPEKLKRLPDGEEIYGKLKKLWEKLPICAIINNDVFAVHGGIYTRNCKILEEGVSLNDLKTDEAKIEMMWNDPYKDDTCYHNFERGIGYFFGIKATRRFLKDIGLRIVVRSHQPYKVLKAEHEGLVVTLGSTTVYYTDFAILKVEGEFRNGYDMIRKYGYVFYRT